MTPIDVVLGILPALNEKDKNKIREALGKGSLSPCERDGHRYPTKPVEIKGSSWFDSSKKFYVCQKCGHKLEV